MPNTLRPKKKKSIAEKNLRIFKSIDLSKKSSIDKYFKFIDGKGTRKPPITITGISSDDYTLCFREIREWRKLTKKIQREQCEKVTLMDETLKRSYLKKRKEGALIDSE